MEDGDISEMEVSASIKAAESNDLLNKMANYPDVEVTVIKNKNNTDCSSKSCENSTTKVNGESEKVNSCLSDDDQEEFSSDDDALIIDEDINNKSSVDSKSCVNNKRFRSPSPRVNFKGFKKRIIEKSHHSLKIVNELKKFYHIDDDINHFEEESNKQKQGELNATITKDSITQCLVNDSDNKTGTRDNCTLTNQKHKKSLTAASTTHIESSLKHKQHVTIPSLKSSGKKPIKKRPSQKLTEYAQYLGLQPAVKFKCVKCSESSFPSLSALNEHQRQCLVQPQSHTKVAPSSANQTTTTTTTTSSSSSSSSSAATIPASIAPLPPPSSSSSLSSSTTIPTSTSTSTNFRVTRKVFLCSSCGTYYENCNLFLHMREVHRRYICLYCLGMFSLPEKLSHHLVTKHNCSPNHYSSAEDFLSSYSESCFLVCCQCERVFSERDNFYEHVCTEKRAKLPITSTTTTTTSAAATTTATTSSSSSSSIDTTCWSCGIKDSSVHLPSCRASIDQPPPPVLNTTHNQKQNSKSIHPKSQKHKTLKSSLKTGIVQQQQQQQHIAADISGTNITTTTSTSTTTTTTTTTSTPLENEEDKTGGHFLADMNFCKNILTDTDSENMSKKIETPPSQSIENTDLNENSTKDATEMEICDNNDENETKIDDVDTDAIDSPTTTINNKEVVNNLDENNTDAENATEIKTEENDTIRNECNDITSEMETKIHSDSENNAETSNLDGNNTSETYDATISSTEENFDVSHTSENKNEDDSEEKVDNSKEQNDDDDDEKSDHETKESSENTVVEDTRKVPKVTLKLPPKGLIYSENESDDSEKLTMEVDANDDSECDESLEHAKNENENENENDNDNEKPVNGIDESEKNNSDQNQSDDDDSFQIAGDEVSIIELELDQPLDKFKIEDLIKTCLSATIPTCIYCNHARKIAVNGKQLGLHAIAEHRFSATVNSITAEELIPKNFVQRMKEGLDEIENVYFSLEEQKKVEEEIKEDGQLINTFKHSYECFQCRFITLIHKELYLHNRKMHAKTILLCIMCKSNFYSYSELICHLCPGNYVLNSETKFRCCMCDSNNLPSAFRLMVHLRKKHHTCDVCLEGCHNQSKLSNHVWKHKLHHLCYRCGIAYRNKPDITKHLFWKHGTESVLCKKCLQKKWPHVYHFCVPPLSFVCEECNLIFSKAVYLKVHKRLHINEKPHACQEENCGETFISKKLLLKHELKHREPIPIETCDDKPVKENDVNIKVESKIEENLEKTDNKESTEATKEDSIVKEPGSPEKEEAKQKSIIDVYDLPALNLSESDSDSEDEKPKAAITATTEIKTDEKPENLPNLLPDTNENITAPLDEEQKPVPILDGIWDNFKNYQATIEKNILNTDLSNSKEDTEKDEKLNENIEESIPDINVILADHDYCLPQSTKDEIDDVVMKSDETTGLDHDYCTVITTKMPHSNQVTNSTSDRPKTPENTEKKKVKTPKKKSTSSSDSSSDSDSSSCTCGSNCSCSSSSGSSSSSSSSSDSDSSSSEGKRRIAARRERRKERAKRKKESETSNVTNTSAVDVVANEDPVPPVPVIEIPIQESDLETDETETDEDFYDEYPQRLVNKILAEKRNQLALLASVAPVSNGVILENSRPSTPGMPEETSTTTPPITTTPATATTTTTTTASKKKVKSKKRKKKSRSSTPKQEQNIPDYVNHHSPMQVQSIPATPIIHQPPVPSPLSIHSIPPAPQAQTVPPLSLTLTSKSQILSQHTPGSGSETETSVRSSKRRRVPNKFYGYSSDDERTEKQQATPVLKWRKADLPTPPSHVTGSPQLVPPITIKNIPSPAPVVEPVRMAPVIIHHNEVQESDSEVEEVQNRKSATDSSDENRNDDSDSDTGQLHISQPQPAPQTHHHHHHHPRPPVFPSGPHHSMAGFKQGERNENLYCYCQCPYDEVSEMIACDGKDCAIEWFHFECVGIMVPPKGKWFCPDCRKRNSQRGDFIQI